MRGHRDLIAWQKAMELVKAIYAATRTFPKEELYCLTSQLRRAAISVPIARGSLLEIETQLEIARDLGYLTAPAAAELLAQASEVARLVNGLRAWSESEVGNRAADS